VGLYRLLLATSAFLRHISGIQGYDLASGRRCNPRFRCCFLRCLVASAGIRALGLVTERLSPEHLALPVGRSARRRAVGHLG